MVDNQQSTLYGSPFSKDYFTKENAARINSESPLNMTSTAYFQLRQVIHLEECCYMCIYHHIMQQDESFNDEIKELQSKVMKESSKVTENVLSA
ncbi:hypothetical protein CEXT_606081 [Caerostris extrusa]|uniref:Uncharacterized protein n=1 Tax=Caerostris extrusa TaxID=172846 RepID=A0AAV4PW58_CAEEX|nr:hypothetical protein CEXT_606081 [Caerostris extrusa]